MSYSGNQATAERLNNQQLVIIREFTGDRPKDINGRDEPRHRRPYN